MDTNILKSKLQQKISYKIANSLITEAVILKADASESTSTPTSTTAQEEPGPGPDAPEGAETVYPAKGNPYSTIRRSPTTEKQGKKKEQTVKANILMDNLPKTVKAKLQEKISYKIANSLITEAVILKADATQSSPEEGWNWGDVLNWAMYAYVGKDLIKPLARAAWAARPGRGAYSARARAPRGPSRWQNVRNVSNYIKNAQILQYLRNARYLAAAARAGGAAVAVGGPPAAAALGGLAIGTAASYGINSAWDALDSNTWKHGGSRRKMQQELLGLGDEGTFSKAWADVAGGLVQNIPGLGEPDVKSEIEAHKKQVHKLNPDLKARQEEERRQREANRQQDELEQRGKIQ